jgi:Cu+-exporting ATPase
MVIDPVCGMSVDPTNSVFHADYKGKTYYFCSADCKAQFQAQPERYLKQPVKTE